MFNAFVSGFCFMGGLYSMGLGQTGIGLVQLGLAVLNGIIAIGKNSKG